MHVQCNSTTTPLIYTDEAEDGMRLLVPRRLEVEEYLIYAARVSNPENQLNISTAPKLLKYLIKHDHWSPFEMVSFGFEIKTSRAIAQQLLRHRSFSFQEFSQRYSEITEMEPIQLRKAGSKNRQSSTDEVGDKLLEHRANTTIIRAVETYKDLISEGVAKETARMVLPLTTQTTIIMHGTLRSWIHFFNQRCSEHAQKEIRVIANAIKDELSELCPWTSAALNWDGEHFTPLSKRERLRELLIRTVKRVI